MLGGFVSGRWTVIAPRDRLDEKYQSLLAALARHTSAIVAFSGGVDSTFLLRAACEALPADKVRAIIGVSPSLQPDNLALARRVAAALPVALEEVPTREMEREGYVANAGDRCFHCKNELFSVLEALRRAADEAVIWDGTNLDDLQGHRPGRRAAELHGVESPLAVEAWTKHEVRAYSRRLGLETWDRPSSPCLASRVPAGIRVTTQALDRVYRAESGLRKLGFPQVRVRDHGATARVEVPVETLAAVVSRREAVVGLVRGAGYRFVTLDLEGYRPSGGEAVAAENERTEHGLTNERPERDG